MGEFFSSSSNRRLPSLQALTIDIAMKMDTIFPEFILKFAILIKKIVYLRVINLLIFAIIMDDDIE